MKFALRACVLIALASTLAACGGRNQTELAYVEQPVEQLYNEGFSHLERRRYQEAAQFFDEVERQHPFSEWARRSMLMAAYANYRGNNYEEAISDAERFVALHPGSSSAPYAYYLIAVSHYERIYDVGRDQSTTRQAMDALQQVVRRYPGTPYAQDARLKIDMTRDHLAGKEMSVGRWYLRNGYHLAAINRFQTVIQDYQTTSHVPEALHRLVESYVSLGVDEEARQVAAVLGHNFPGSAWYSDSYDLLTSRGIDVPGDAVEEEDPGLLRRAMDRIFG
ncbi:outer membrane protein assembly factor BamD [Marinicauda salina]|jgi:outer membrane protein assembly factor BamD|uniref:Outer membrane protein assembly factor BamD n=1 Tax=Marinicauda salina TaxID=2135793 RepID=A0A2U2BUK3_9PROT|nr:outer membrane protein assembly factor BamD [Marinicauda salina]PWE17711.1 outer membrane protein assembly factor BamD [Marinicauda salina]